MKKINWTFYKSGLKHLNALKKGLLDEWIEMHRLIASKKLPLNNMALLLSLDVVRFHGCTNVSAMRYPTETKSFWKAAYRIFRSRILRLMGGPKFYRVCTEGAVDQAKFDPSNAEINFAVPNISCLETDDEQQEMKPKILHSCIKTLASAASSKYIKVSLIQKRSMLV
jgi:hypothetical protein